MNFSKNGYHNLLEIPSEVIYGVIDIDSSTSIIIINSNISNKSFTESKDFISIESLTNRTLNFLSRYSKTPRTGSAHDHFGITLETFLISIVISIVYFIIQFLVFNKLRNQFVEIYQINYLPFLNKFSEIQKKTNFFRRNFSWFKILYETSIEKYILTCGLDAYLFIRFLKRLFIFFLILSVVHVPILLPIHFFSNNNDDMPRSLDRLNMSNILDSNSSLLLFHLILSTFVVIWFHCCLISEFQQIFKNYQKEKYLGKYQNTIFIDNIPTALHGNYDKIVQYFDNILPNSISNINFFPKSCTQFQKIYKNLNSIDLSLNEISNQLILNRFFKKRFKRIQFQKLSSKQKITLIKNYLKFKLILFPIMFFLHFYIHWILVPMINVTVPILKFRTTNADNDTLLKEYFQKKWILYNKNLAIWEEMCLNYKSYQLFSSFSNGKKINNVVSYKKAMITFNSNVEAHIFGQILLSRNITQWNNILIGPNPKDILWENAAQSSFKKSLARSILINITYILIILGWILPIACLGLLMHIDDLNPLQILSGKLRFHNALLTDLFSNIVSIITLVFLTEIVPYIFYWLGCYKSWKTGAEIELGTQKWFFIFLFVHLFLIVTISSGIYFVIEKVIINPTSIAILLAHELPKSSNFFCSFILIRCLAYAGGNFLQIKDLSLEILHYKLFYFSPKKKFNRLKSFIIFNWGCVYSLFSVFGCIGIIYSVLAPIILPICFVSFLLVYISMKYLFEFECNKENVSETHGKLYIQALLHLYTGIYCMEFCMIGIFALSNHRNMTIFMIFVFILTVMANYKIYEVYASKIFQPALCNFEIINNNKRKKYYSKDNMVEIKDSFPIPFMIPTNENNKFSLWMLYDTTNQVHLREMSYQQRENNIESYTKYYSIDTVGNLKFNFENNSN